MEQKLLEQSQQYKAKRKKKRRLKKLFNILACVVVFCVTYALILPAITMEKKSYCGYEEHTHGDKCYSKALICAMQEGENAEGHSHGDGCYREERTLVCQVTESAGHTHSSECKTTEKTLACGIEESEEHVHNDACYQASEKIACGIEESSGHAHGDACYENKKVVICTLPEASAESGHKHKDACYEKKLTCEKEEHEHELICHSNKNADVETSTDWEATLPKELTGVWAEDVLAIAESQLGYEESSKNYNVTEDGKTLGYTRYGDWYGDSYGHWCAMYVSFCLHYANVDTDMIPLDANCQHWIDTLSKEEYNLYHEAGTYEPVPGDLIFFNWDSDPRSEHIGLVVEYTPATEDEPAEVRTIEGNASDVVKYKTYKAEDSRIMGYGELPENPELEVAMEKQTLEASIYTDATFETEAKEDKTVITVSGYFPEGIEAKAYPVELEEETIEGRRVLLAYDITLFDKDGNIYDTEELEIPMTVTIEPAEWSIEDEEVDSEDCEVYYVPEEGEPESMETSTEEDVVSFQTDHFSTYALTVGGTKATVYLNGASGNDSNDGSQNKPVKTLDRAFELVADKGTIYITGTVTVSNEKGTEIDITNEVTIKRYSTFTGVLITVPNGGSLKLGNIRIHGGTDGPSTGSIETTTTYAIISSRTYAQAPLIEVKSGGNLEIADGAILEYNSNKPDSVSTSGYKGQGGAVYCQGNLTMTGGIIQYCEALSGGGIYIESANTNRITFNLSGGTIQHNYAREILSASVSSRKSPYHKNAGGGVYVGDYVTMNMSGGTISNNQSAREGGGISLGWLNRSKGKAIYEFLTTFNMTGGTFTGNVATSTGGGLNVAAGREAYISAGEFTKNKAYGQEYQPGSGTDVWEVYSGGAIYLDSAQYDGNGKPAGKPGYASISRVIVTKNKATVGGGGIACCSTSNSSFNASADFKNGTAIYGNTAPYDSYFRLYLGHEMYLTGTVKLNTEYILGGTTKYQWSTESYKYDGVTYVCYDNSLTDDSGAIKEANKVYTVMISGNEACIGGGIGCNGQIDIGGVNNTTSISITKKWEDNNTIVHPEYITVQILQNGKPYGNPIQIFKSKDETGKEIWPTYYVDNLPTGYKYSVQEVKVPGFIASITPDGNHFTITNTPDGFQVIKKWLDENQKELTENLPESIEVQLYQNGTPYKDTVMLNAAKKWTHIWTDLPKVDEEENAYEYTVKEVVIPEGFYSTSLGELDENGRYVITNIKSPVTSVSVEKVWAEGIPEDMEIQVQLLQKNGEQSKEYGDPVTLNDENEWFHTWTDLPTLDKDGNEVTYEVTELPVAGYYSSVELSTATGKRYKWVADTKFTDQTSYLVVSDEGALQKASDNTLKWEDVSSALKSGDTVDNSLLWKSSSIGSNGISAKLQNSTGGYLRHSSNQISIVTNSYQATTIYYSDKKLYISGSRKYYFAGINSGVGNTNSDSSKAKTITLYKRVEKEMDYGDQHYIVTNTQKPDSIPIKFAKYATGGEELTLIAGAKLKLYQLNESGEDTIPGTSLKGMLIQEWESEDANSVTDGKVVVDVVSGTYYLVETAPPAGHAGLKGPIIFEVDVKAGNITIKDYPGYSNVEVTPGNFPIYNEILYELPETGGIGTNMFTTGGTVLMMGSLFVGYLMRRKRERRV